MKLNNQDNITSQVNIIATAELKNDISLPKKTNVCLGKGTVVYEATVTTNNIGMTSRKLK